MHFKTTVWSEGDWGLWRHNTMKSDRGTWEKYMLFHTCGDKAHPERRVAKQSDESYMCVVCCHRAPNGAVAVLELMNWEEE